MWVGRSAVASLWSSPRCQRARRRRPLFVLALVASIVVGSSAGPAAASVTVVEAENVPSTTWVSQLWGCSCGNRTVRYNSGGDWTFSLTLTVDATVGFVGFQDAQSRYFSVAVDGGTATPAANLTGAESFPTYLTTGTLAAGSHSFTLHALGAALTGIDSMVVTSVAPVTTTTVPATTTTVPPTTTTTVPTTTTTTVPPPTFAQVHEQEQETLYGMALLIFLGCVHVVGSWGRK